MFLRYFVLVLVCLPLVVSALTDEEKLERQRVLDKFANEETKRAIENEDKGIVEKTKEQLSDGLDSLKEKLPENMKKMIQGDDSQVVKPNQANAASATDVEADLQAAQEGGEVLDPDAEMEKLNTGEVPSGGMPKIDPAELSKIMKNLDGNPLLKMLSPQQREAAAKMMKQNPFATMKKDAIKNIILTKMDAKKPAGKFLHDNPKLVDVTAEWIIDDKAIPAFISIINKPDKAKIMGGVVVGVFITVFLLNLKNSKNNILKRIFFKIVLMLGSATVNFSAFYLIYKEELGPTVDVISRSM